MFGSSKTTNLEMRIQHLQESLDKMTEEKKKVENDLVNAKAKIADLEDKLSKTDLEQLKKETKETLAEYEGLKELYLKKNQDFDSSLQTKEENYAKEESLARHHLKEEIVQTKRDTEKAVSDTVSTFSETYNYYLNQIKVLMDTLGNVATSTGKQLFSGEAVDLKTEFGRQMVNALKQGTDTLPQGSGDRILIGTSEEEAAAEEAKAAKAAKKTVKKAAAKKPAAKKKPAAAKAAGAKKSTAAKAAGKTARVRKPRAPKAEAPAEAAAAAQAVETAAAPVAEKAAAAAENISENVKAEVKEATGETVAVDGGSIR